MIVLGGLFGLAFLRNGAPAGGEALPRAGSRRMGAAALALFFALLAGLPLLAAATGDGALRFLDTFYRAGALVFGGGHVVLPLLETDLVGGGWVSADGFLAGYGAAQAVPGPLFTFASYLGAAIGLGGNGWLGALAATAAIFLPSMLLVAGVLPFWERLRRRAPAQAALRG